MKTFDIPRNRIFYSRNTSFLPEVMRETGGKGVDIVLNSLFGELLHASWKCVAEFGKMVEIGKRDFIGFGKLNMDLFETNRSFCGIDLAQVYSDRPTICNKSVKVCPAKGKSLLIDYPQIVHTVHRILSKRRHSAN
jgi:NADPH:quinone reductase-like Zn-dependent oxidoreductase